MQKPWYLALAAGLTTAAAQLGADTTEDELFADDDEDRVSRDPDDQDEEEQEEEEDWADNMNEQANEAPPLDDGEAQDDSSQPEQAIVMGQPEEPNEAPEDYAPEVLDLADALQPDEESVEGEDEEEGREEEESKEEEAEDSAIEDETEDMTDSMEEDLGQEEEGLVAEKEEELTAAVAAAAEAVKAAEGETAEPPRLQDSQAPHHHQQINYDDEKNWDQPQWIEPGTDVLQEAVDESIEKQDQAISDSLDRALVDDLASSEQQGGQWFQPEQQQQEIPQPPLSPAVHDVSPPPPPPPLAPPAGLSPDAIQKQGVTNRHSLSSATLLFLAMFILLAFLLKIPKLKRLLPKSRKNMSSSLPYYRISKAKE
ncbi:hypothetical protein BCR43DRAFT_566971 [Syncephalastrum racemosum]|uniref:Uncharacterized protein n=1 Tax=Syncephalastrum racemosum TaxID=13706 RepID=A0A1X2H007_SYNRA|nr:hypothetical protein BCR43DRAFT_566971 [Syncephalastrum racemosum]